MKNHSDRSRARDAHQMLGKLIAAQNERRRKDKREAQPQVGIIFMVGNRLFIEATPVDDSETYADCKTHGNDHYTYWNQLLRNHAVPSMEYEEVPRARCVFNTRTGQFALYADRCILHKPATIKRIMKWMNLPNTAKVLTDSHYRCAFCLRSKTSFDDL
jgi:hypothetical protein